MNPERSTNLLCLIKGLGLGGAEMLLPIALPHIDRRRYNFHVGYFLPWKNALVTQIENHGVPVTCLSSGRHIDWRALTRLIGYIRKHEIGLIHAHLPYAGLLARVAGRITRTPVVYTEHNVWDRLNPWMRWANRISYGMHARAIAVSDQVAGSMHGIDAERVRVVLNGIDCDWLAATPDDSAAVRAEFGIPSGHFLVGKVANLTPKKNHENLLDAFAEMSRVHPDASLLLVGQLAGRDQMLRERAEALGIADRLILTGARTDVPRLLRAMDVFAISSDFEGLPVAMLEAMAMGVPVVATTVGGIPAVISDGIHGLLVPPKRPDLLGSALLRLATDDVMRLTLSDRGRQRIRAEFDIRHMVGEVEAIYQEVLEEHQQHADR